MRGGVRLAVGVAGLSVAVYGLASLTGAWLGAPPWAVRLETRSEVDDRWFTTPHGGGPQVVLNREEERRGAPLPVRREGWEVTSWFVVGLGVSLASAAVLNARRLAAGISGVALSLYGAGAFGPPPWFEWPAPRFHPRMNGSFSDGEILSSWAPRPRSGFAWASPSVATLGVALVALVILPRRSKPPPTAA